MSRMSLDSITGGVVVEPLRTIVYAEEGVGKSTFAAGAEAPVFLDVEGGSKHIDVQRFPVPETADEIFEAIDNLFGDQQHKTLVIDTLDKVQQRFYEDICKKGGKTSISEFDYGKGTAMSLEYWERLITKLDSLRDQKGMDIIMLCHAVNKTIKNPTGLDHNKIVPALYEKAWTKLKGWCDVVGFAHKEVFFTEEGKGFSKTVKSAESGRRLLGFEGGRGFEGKTRWDLPQTVDMPKDEAYGPFIRAIRTAQEAKTKDYTTLIADELAALTEEKREEVAPKVEQLLASAPSVDKLIACHARLQTINQGG